MIKIADAIMVLRPNTEFSITNEDLSTIIWHTENVVPLTEIEVNQKLEELKSESESFNSLKLAKIQSALTKLQALGLTEEEAKAIAGI